MNSAILHANRSREQPRRVPKDVMRMARQMGIGSSSDIQKEAEEIWKMLDDMSRNDPEAYTKFVKENTSPEAAAVAAGTHFVPNAGFVVKTVVIVRERAVVQEIGEEKVVKKKAFVNITSHQAIEAPTTPSGEKPRDGLASADGLAIPLAVGQPRDWRCVLELLDGLLLQSYLCWVRHDANVRDSNGQVCVVVDVVVHPWVVRQCQTSSTMKVQVVNLALDWVKQETKLELSSEWKLVKSIYKGSSSADDSSGSNSSDSSSKATPVPFPIQQMNEQTVPIGERLATTGAVLSSPTELLANVRAAAQQEAKAEGVVEHVQVTKQEKLQPKHSSLIQEVGASNTIASSAEQKTAVAAKAQPAVKRGFLNQSSTRLYGDEGSGNGSNPGALARLMDKCKVVDLQHTQPKATSLAEPDRTRAIAPEKPKRDLEMEALMARVDDEFRAASSWETRQQEASAIELNQFAELSKFFGDLPTPVAPSTSQQQQQQQQQQQHRSTPEQPQSQRVEIDNPTSLAVTAEVLEASGMFEVRIDKVDFVVGEAELLTSVNQIVLVIAERGKLRITSPVPLQSEATKASFSRKANRFKITVPLLQEAN